MISWQIWGLTWLQRGLGVKHLGQHWVWVTEESLPGGDKLCPTHIEGHHAVQRHGGSLVISHPLYLQLLLVMYYTLGYIIYWYCIIYCYTCFCLSQVNRKHWIPAVGVRGSCRVRGWARWCWMRGQPYWRADRWPHAQNPGQGGRDNWQQRY